MLFAVAAVLIGGAVLIARPTDPVAQKPENQTAGGVLTAAETSFDFGAISMAKGKVTHAFEIVNSSDASVTITKIYTSCMCTEAILAIDGRRRGPFGMPGHGGFVPGIRETLAPGARALVETTFDPAAHGPAGVGAITRAVTVETGRAAPLQLMFSAVVTP